MAFRDVGLQDEFTVPHRLRDKGQAIGWGVRKELLDFGGGGAHLLVDLALHAAGKQLLTHRLFEFGLPLAHALAVFRFEPLDATEHIDVVRQPAVDFVHYLCVGDLNAVQFGMVHEQFLEQQFFKQVAALGCVQFCRLAHLCQLRFHGEGLGFHFALQHDSVADHRHNGIDGGEVWGYVGIIT